MKNISGTAAITPFREIRLRLYKSFFISVVLLSSFLTLYYSTRIVFDLTSAVQPSVEIVDYRE